MIRTSVAPQEAEEAKAGQMAHCPGTILTQEVQTPSRWFLRNLLPWPRPAGVICQEYGWAVPDW